MKNRIRRPSRFQQRYARYDVTLNGRLMIEALAAVKEGEQALDRMARTPHGTYSVEAHKTVQARYQTAKTRLQNRLR